MTKITKRRRLSTETSYSDAEPVSGSQLNKLLRQLSGGSQNNYTKFLDKLKKHLKKRDDKTSYGHKKIRRRSKN